MGFIGLPPKSNAPHWANLSRTPAFWLHLVNTHFMRVNEMPHGGLKPSGYGKDLSMYPLEDYTVARHVVVKL